MKSMNLIFLLLLAALPAVGQAHYRCVQETYIPLRTDIARVGFCEIVEPLQLVTGHKMFPLLSGSTFRVQYWQGVYARNKVTTTTYLHEVYDQCSRRQLLSREESYSRSQRELFGFENPNLLDSIDATYKLVPMTEHEAWTAFELARQRCSI